MSKILNLNHGKVRALALSIFMVALSASLTYQPAQAQRYALISIEPNNTTVLVSTEFSVDLVVSKLSEKLKGALIIASYDPTQIELVDGMTHPPKDWLLLGYDWIADGTGYFIIVGFGKGVEPEATLATIDFHCLTEGTTTIDLPDSCSVPKDIESEMLNDLEAVDLSELTSDAGELSELDGIQGELLAEIQEDIKFAYLACGIICRFPFDTMDGVVNQVSGAVGGTAVSVNKFTLLAPYIALAAVAIGLTSIAIKKRRD